VVLGKGRRCAASGQAGFLSAKNGRPAAVEACCLDPFSRALVSLTVGRTPWEGGVVEALEEPVEEPSHATPSLISRSGKNRKWTSRVHAPRVAETFATVDGRAVRTLVASDRSEIPLGGGFSRYRAV
jgi:hypothetical protein